MGEEEKQSEWNEQQAFSKLFFEITKVAREFQIRGEVIKWAETIMSKLSLVLGICDKEKGILHEYRKDLIKSRNNYIKSGNAFNKGKLYELCFSIEAEVDSISNKYMPFLKIKRTSDISGL